MHELSRQFQPDQISKITKVWKSFPTDLLFLGSRQLAEYQNEHLYNFGEIIASYIEDSMSKEVYNKGFYLSYLFAHLLHGTNEPVVTESALISYITTDTIAIKNQRTPVMNNEEASRRFLHGELSLQNYQWLVPILNEGNKQLFQLIAPLANVKRESDCRVLYRGMCDALKPIEETQQQLVSYY